jgi:O-antigen polymerase
MICGLQLEQDSSLKKPQRLFFILFGILFLVAPFYYQPNLGGEGLFIPHNSSLWIVASWIIASASFLVYKNQQITLPKYWLGLALLPIGALVTGFVADNNNPTEWIVRITVIIGGYLFFLSLFQFQLKPKHVERSLYIILAMGLIAGAYGIIQTQTGALNLGAIMPVSPEYKAVGIFQQVNLQASIMATLLVLTFYLASRPALKSFSLIIKITLIIAAITASFLIAYSGSRVGLISAILGLSLLAIGRWKLMKNAKIMFSVLTLSVIFGATLGQSGLTKTTHKLDRAIGGVEADIRWHIYTLSWDIFTKAPITGHGLGSFQKVFQEERADYQKKGGNNLERSPRFSHPHNEIIFWLVEGGMIAIIGIITAAICTFLQLIKLGWQRGFGYAALLFPIAFHTQVELPFYISNTHWLLLLLLLFITHQSNKREIKTTTLSVSAQRTLPIFFLIIAITGSVSLVNTQVANAGIVNYLKRNQSHPTYLQSSLESTYFREYTTYLLLRREMIIGIQSSETQPAENYIAWATESIKTIPAISSYRDLVVAYNSLRKIDQRDQTLEKALGIYPRDESLLRLKDRFTKNADGQIDEQLSNGELKSLSPQPANQ